MSYPLVKELAADGIPVVVSCRVLKLSRQPYYRWLSSPVTDRERGRRIARTRCSTLIGTIRSSVTGSSLTRATFGRAKGLRVASGAARARRVRESGRTRTADLPRRGRFLFGSQALAPDGWSVRGL